ncbi:MAG: UDP-N-acetylmuramoyl-tripeptide--D-alanyl-D-alanine ligase [Planctomycetota bacterium]|nr:UDP-N-acetylmuramoyl-tripeptide--D-alanyl-D-alanine ligase [Planctomycetota bacterium]
MSDFLAGDVAAAVGGSLLSGAENRVLHGVSTDTRAIEPGQLFLALSGPNFDGNAFAAKAIEAGAGGVLVRGGPDGVDGIDDATRAAMAAGDLAVITHPDPRRALAQLAGWYRRRLGLPVIGITGSCGKTTTKDYLVQLLGRVRRVVGSPRSFNNDVGVPLTLLAADGATEALIAEIGTSGAGEIERLCRIATPDIGVVTNIGASHLEGLGSLEGVAAEKSALATCLPADGFLVLNADCRFHELFRGATRARVLTFSIEGEGDLNATDLVFDGGRSVFQLDGHEVCLPALGTHNVQNLLAALAVCVGLGHRLEDVLPGVAEISGQSGRLETFELEGLRLVDDSYNANPTSARAAVRVLAGMHGHDRRVLILGDMLELGEFAAELHHEVGRAAAEAGIDRLILIGDLTRAAAAGALEGGMGPSQVLHFASRDEAEAGLYNLVGVGDVVLVKGSRGMALERIVGALRTRFAKGASHAGGGTDIAMACYAGWEVR